MNNRFYPERIIKQVYNCLRIPKGSFIFDRDLGSNLYNLDIRNENALKTCIHMVEDALSRLPEVKLTECKLITFNNRYKVTVEFSYLKNNYETEITIYG